VPTIAFLGGPCARSTPDATVVTHAPDASDAELVALVARADALVFVATPATLALWERVPELLARAGKPADLPVVIYYADGAELDEELQIQAFLVVGELRLPNPYAMRFPVRVLTLDEALAEAAKAAVAGPFPIPPDAADLAKAMLDRQLAEQLAKLAPSEPDAQQLARRTLRGDEQARARLDQAVRDDARAQFEELRATDEGFQQLLLEQLAAKLDGALVTPDLHCPRCKTRVPIVELVGLRDGPYGTGDRIAAIDFDALDVMLHAPAAGEPLVWLASEPCIQCATLVWCTVTIVDDVIDSVWPAAFTRASLDRAHVAAMAGLQHEAGRILGVDPETLTSRAAILRALERL